MILNIFYKYSSSPTFRGDHVTHYALTVNAELMMIYVCKCVKIIYVHKSYIQHVFITYLQLRQQARSFISISLPIHFIADMTRKIFLVKVTVTKMFP